MNLSILIVEDSEVVLDEIAILINSLDESKKSAAGIEKILIDKANCISLAEEFLRNASSQNRPYDLLLLDLSLPNRQGDTDNVRGGLDLISTARQLNAAKEITIVSANINLDTHITESFTRGANDFIRKPYSPVELQQKVLNAVKLLNERYLSKLRRLVDERIHLLSASIWKSTAQQFSSRIYTLIQTVVYETEELHNALQHLSEQENTGLHQSMRSNLARIETAASAAREDMAELQKSFYDPGQESGNASLSAILENLAEDLQPCVAVKCSQLMDEFPILCLRNGVQVVLKEILVGGLSENSNSTRTWFADVTVKGENGRAAVCIHDNFSPLEAEVADRINKGENILPQETSKLRDWGLSLAQQIALRGGGRLIVEPQENGNLITYLIPLA